MTTGPTNLADLASATLAAIVAAFTADGVALPTRRYVTTGDPLGVRDAVIVSWMRVWSGVAGFAETPALLDGGSARVATLTAHIFRCGYPTPQGAGQRALVEPAETEFNTFAASVMTDAYVLHRGLQRAYREGMFTDYASRVRLGPAEPLQPQGAMAGVTMQIEAALH